jgi:Pyruvate/2-oxoacid:ferredoxin oxidoreductase gamma subunit
MPLLQEEVKPIASMSAVKVSESKVEITIQPETPEPKVEVYDYDFLINQRASIIKQANDFMTARQVELDDIDAKLALCDEQGVTSAVMPEKLN